MALFARTITDQTLGDNTPCDAHRHPSGKAGEDLKVGPLYLNANGRWYQSTGVANDAAAKVHGWCLFPTKSGQAVDPYKSPLMLPWGPTSATPGTPLYLSATKGELDTATTTGGLTPCAFVCGIRTAEGHAQIAVREIW